MSVDLPTPDEPSSTTVRPGPRYGVSSSRPSRVNALTVWTGTPKAIASTAAIRSPRSSIGQRSALFRMIAGSAPLSQAVAR